MEPVACNDTNTTRVGIGTAIGDYVIEELLGHGSEGDVFLARDLLLGRRVAMKTLRQHGTEVTHGVEEARLMVSVEHPNIVRVYHAQRHNEIWVVIFEHVDGGSLRAQVQRMGPLTPARALTLLGQAAAGLSYAHEIGILHRDVKPDNLLLSRQGQIKLADFGLACDIRGGARVQGVRVGTPAFLAPELWSNGAASPASDIYSLGGCLYFMLTGRLPFPFSNPDQLARAHLKLTPKVPAETPSAVKDILLAMMAKDPAARPVSDGQLSRELLALAHDPNRSRRGSLSHRSKESPNPFVAEGQALALDFALSRGPDAPYLDKLVAALSAGPRGVQLSESQPGAAELLLRVALDRCTPSPERLGRVSVTAPTANLGELLRHKAQPPFATSHPPTYPAQPSPSASVPGSHRLLEVEAADGLTPLQTRELAAFLESAFGYATTIVLIRSNAAPSGSAMTPALPGLLVLDLPRHDAPFCDFVERVRLWTSVATGGRWDFTSDALRVLRHLCRRPGCLWPELTRDSLWLAAGARLPIVTSWAVRATQAQASAAGAQGEMPGDWRHVPRRWPTPEAFSMLAGLRVELDQELAVEGPGPVRPLIAHPTRTVREHSSV